MIDDSVVEKLNRDRESTPGSATGESHSILLKSPFHAEEEQWLEIVYRYARVGDAFYGVMVGRDVTDRVRSHKTVAALLAEKEALLENALVGIASVKERRFLSCNSRLAQILGYATNELLGQSTRIMFETTGGFELFGEHAYLALASGDPFTATMKLVRSDGSTFWCELDGKAIDPANPNAGRVWIFSDINERKLAEDRARFLSYYDALTGLPNHQLFQDRIQQAIALCTRLGTKCAVVTIDIDRFKSYNDFLGYEGGNSLLIAVADRLKPVIRNADTLCRQGSDEFLLLLTNLEDPEEIVIFLRDLFAQFNVPFVLNNQDIAITVSAGVSIYPEDGADYVNLLRKADMAMYRAKETGRNSYRFYNDEMNAAVIEQVTIHSGLRRALARNEFELHFQPQFELASNRIVGAEALIRWNHPELGMVPPSRFISIAEESGLIVELGEWIIEEACRQASRWQNCGLAQSQVAVNLSAVQFKFGDIESTVIKALSTSGLDPRRLELELTESILIRDPENVLAKIKRLKALGIKLSIDDFGTGYSSLSYLKRFEVDKLKIDQSFIRDLDVNPEDAAIVRAIVQMAKSLGLRTIAEGVEKFEAVSELQNIGCDEVQGYYFARPMPSEAFIAAYCSPCLDKESQGHS